MIFDFYAHLFESLEKCPTDGPLPCGLASGFVDNCTVWSTKGGDQRNEARNSYMGWATKGALALPSDLGLDRWPPRLLSARWLAFEVEFELLTPWYSKDDRIFHVLDNPVRKDRVFGVPFMAAASWKGMLRWAFLMVTKLIGPDQEKDASKRKQAKAMELHLFGNEKGEEKSFHQGALVFYPTWFNKIGFEVINPHDRSRRADTQPIYYEVVPGRQPKAGKENEYDDGGKGALCLLYAPWPGMKAAGKPKEVLPHLLEAIETLLTIYGISAKRTVGWGTAQITKWRAWRRGRSQPAEATTREDLEQQIRQWLEAEAGQ